MSAKTNTNYTVKVIMDECPENPREAWDNLGTMVCFHSRYKLGDEDHGYNSRDFSGWDELEREIISDHGDCVILPMYMYDHSGITVNTTGFSSPWDSGQIGLIFISLKEARKAYSWKKVTKARRAHLELMLRSEVSLYDSYLQGEVYGYKVLDAEGEELDSCWGFYGKPETSGLFD